MKQKTTNKLRLFVVCLLSVAVEGCPALDQPGKGKLQEDWPIPTTIPAFRDNLYGLDGLRAMCTQTKGATFLESKKECRCASDDARKVFSSLNGGSCLPMQYKNETGICNGKTATETLKYGGISALNMCLQSLARFYRTTFGITLSDSLSKKDASALAHFIDEHMPSVGLNLWPTLESHYFNGSARFIVGKAQIDKEFIEDVIAPANILERKRLRTSYIEPEAKNLAYTFQGGLPFPNPPGNIAYLATVIHETLKRFLAMDLSSDHINVGGDCRVYCVVKEHLGLDPITNTEAVRFKWYMAGVPFRDIIKFQKLDENLAYVQLTPWGNVSAILFAQSGYDGRSDSVYSNISVFDRLWQKVGEERFEITSQLSRKVDLAYSVPAITGQERGGIVLCETVNLDQFDSRNVLSSLRRRPAPIDHQSLLGSILGWLPNGTGLMKRFIDPVVELRDGLIPEPGAESHGFGVAGTIISANRDTALIPISMPSCIGRYRDWANLVSRYGVKIVNLSGTEPVDAKWCNSFHNPSTYLGKDMPFLWIMAAGNSGERNPKDRCPQAIGPRENMIVVAGGEHGNLWSYSDYGTNYADIVADYHSGVTTEQGTSYSAARVSAVASDIAAQFNSLSPDDIRLAVLFGADVPDTPLDVRSGGVLDRDLSLKIAETLSTLPRNIRRNLTENELHQLLSEPLSSYETERRIRVWKERGLIR